MSEEKEPSQDKQSKLKLKLKKMGVIRDEGTPPAERTHSFSHSKIPVIIVVFLALVFWWWYSNKHQTSAPDVAQNATTQLPAAYPPEFGYGPSPSLPPSPRAGRGAGSQNNSGDNTSTGSAPVPGWGGPGNRYDDRYGPPPGWQPAYPPPPPPGYYGYPYYGPPAYYPNPYYRGY